jgi:hypothetical protein
VAGDLGPFALVRALVRRVHDAAGRLDPVRAWCAGVSLVTLGVIRRRGRRRAATPAA